MSVPAAQERGLAPAQTRGLALRALGYVVVLAVGCALLSRGRPVGVLLVAGLLVAVCVVGLAWVALELRHVRHRPGARLGPTPEGVAALVLDRAAWLLVVEVCITVALAATLLLGGVLVLVAQTSVAAVVVGVVLLALGAGLAALLVPVVTGRVRSGAVYLTATGVEQRVEGTWWKVGWDEVTAVSPGEVVGVVTQPGVEVRRGRTTRWGWSREVRTEDDRVLGIATRHLAVDGAVLTFLLTSYQQRPDLRDALGTQASLDWEILRP